MRHDGLRSHLGGGCTRVDAGARCPSLCMYRLSFVCVPRGLLEMLCWDDVVSARGVRPQWGPPFLCSARRSYGDSGAGAHGRVSQCACRA